METNSHHIFWRRNDYKTSAERLLRRHSGLVIPTSIEPHRELHANLPPPPKPPRQLMFGIINNIRDQEPLSGRLDGLLLTIEYLHEHSSPVADKLANHIEQQFGYLALQGEYEPI